MKTSTVALAALLGAALATANAEPPKTHPDTKSAGWKDLVAADLSDAEFNMDMSKWTEVAKNPDGSEIPAWLNRPAADLDPKGYVGLQGKHAGAPIFFRNMRIKSL